MSVVVDFVYGCYRCHETDLEEHTVRIGERPPAPSLPTGWNVTDADKLLCGRCSRFEG